MSTPRLTTRSGFYGNRSKQRAAPAPTTPPLRRGQHGGNRNGLFTIYRPGMLLDEQPAPVSSINEHYDSESDLDDSFSMENSSSEFSRPTTNLPELSSSQSPLQLARGHSGNQQVILLLQQQAITQVLDGQKAMEGWKTNIEQKMSDLNAKVESIKSSPCSSNDSGFDGKRKRVVTRSLSVSYAELDTKG